MDFDEYEYLESTVENIQLKKLGDKVEGRNGVVELHEKDWSKSSKQRNSDHGDDLDRQSRRSRSRKESGDQDRSSRYGSFQRDKEKGDKDRHMSNRDQRYKDREEGGRKDRARDREQAGARERDSVKERKEYEFERERNREEKRETPKRSRSNSEKDYDENVREISRDTANIDKEYKEVRREKEFRNQENRRNKDKKEKVEPEADPERDQRTVFAYQISLKAGEREVYEFFSRAGKVRDVQLIMDRNTRRSKGVGYIEFYDSMSVPMAIALSGQLLLGSPVMVKPSEAEKNLVQSTSDKVGSSTGEARKLYVGNLPITIKEDHVRQVFEAFGAVELVQMPVDPGTGNCKGYAFVQFSSLEDAKAAENLNGQLVIAGRAIKVSAVADQAGMQEAGAKIADFDDDDGTGLSLNAHSRALLMQKLDRTGTASSITGSTVSSLPGQVSVPVLPGLASADLSIPALSSASIGIDSVPSECLLLQNMFDPNAEAEPEFDLDIKEDVQEECSKFGTLRHIHVEKDSAGFVYLRFEDTRGATAAKNALHGRWFAGKMITATFMPPLNYEAKFPDSR